MNEPYEQQPCCELLQAATGRVLRRWAISDTERGVALADLASLAVTGDALRLGPGTFELTAVLNLTSASNVAIVGSGRGVSTIKRTTGTAGFVISGATIRLRDLSVLSDYAVGAGITSSSVSGGITASTAVYLQNVAVQASYVCVDQSNGSVYVRDCEFTCRNTAIRMAIGTAYVWNCLFTLSCAGNTGIGQDVNVPTAMYALTGGTIRAWNCHATIDATDVELATSSGEVDQCGMFKLRASSVVVAFNCTLTITVGPAAMLVTTPHAGTNTATLVDCWVSGAVDASFGVYACDVAATSQTIALSGGSLVVSGTGSVSFRAGANITLNVSPTACRFDPNSATLNSTGVLTFTNPSAMVIGRELNSASPTDDVGADGEIASNSGASGDNKLYFGTAKNTFAAQT